MDDLLSLGETLQRASAALVGDDIPDETKADGLPVLQVVVVGASVSAIGMLGFGSLQRCTST